MDDLDIYNDLDNFHEQEQQKSKELLDLEKKCEQTKKEIEAVQKENRKLEKKIQIMRTNFQCLLNTARAEINRKDRLIADLRKEKDDICFRRKNVLHKRENEQKQKLKWQQSGETQNVYETNGMPRASAHAVENDAPLNILSNPSKFEEQLRIHEEENANRSSTSSRETKERTKSTRDHHMEKKTDKLPTNDRTYQRSHERDYQRTRESERERNRDRDRNCERDCDRDRKRQNEHAHKRNAENFCEKSRHSKYERQREDRQEHKSRLERDTVHTTKGSDKQKDNKKRYDDRDEVCSKEKSHKSERHETDKNKSAKKHEESRNGKSNKTIEPMQSSTKSVHIHANERLKHTETVDTHSSKSFNSNSSKATAQTIEEKAEQQIEADMLIDATDKDEFQLSTPKKVALYDAVFGSTTQRVGNDNAKLLTNVMELLQKGVNAESKTAKEEEEQHIIDGDTKSRLSENEHLFAAEMVYYFNDKASENETEKSVGISANKVDNVVNIFKSFGGYDNNCIPGLSVADELAEFEIKEKDQRKSDIEYVERKGEETKSNQSELKSNNKLNETSKDIRSEEMQKTESSENDDKETDVCREISREKQSVKEHKNLPDKHQIQSIEGIAQQTFSESQHTESQTANMQARLSEEKEIFCLESIDEDVLECEVDEHMECLDLSAEGPKDLKAKMKNQMACENDPFKLTETIESDEESIDEIGKEDYEVLTSECEDEFEEKKERIQIIEDIRLPVIYELSTQSEDVKQLKEGNVKCDNINPALVNADEKVLNVTINSMNNHNHNYDILSDDDVQKHDDIHIDDDDTKIYVHDDDTKRYDPNDRENDDTNKHVQNDNDDDDDNTNRHIHNHDDDIERHVYNDNVDDDTKRHINNNNDNNNDDNDAEIHAYIDDDDNISSYVHNIDYDDIDTNRHIHNDDDGDDDAKSYIHTDNDGLHKGDNAETHIHNKVNILGDAAKNDVNDNDFHINDDAINDDTARNVGNIHNENVHVVDDAKHNIHGNNNICSVDDFTSHAGIDNADIHDNVVDDNDAHNAGVNTNNVENVNVGILSGKQVHNEDNTNDHVHYHYNDDNINSDNFAQCLHNDDVVDNNDVDNIENDNHTNEDNNDNNMEIASQKSTPIKTVTSITFATTTTDKTEELIVVDVKQSPLHEIEESTVEAEMDVMFKSMEDETKLQQNVNNIAPHNIDEIVVTAVDTTTNTEILQKIRSENATKTFVKMASTENALYEVTTTNDNELEMIQNSEENDEIMGLENSNTETLLAQKRKLNTTANKTNKRKIRIHNNMSSKKRKLCIKEVELSDTVIVAQMNDVTVTNVIPNGTKERTPPPHPEATIENEVLCAVESPGPLRKIRRLGNMSWHKRARHALESSSEDETPTNPAKVSTTKRIVKRRQTIAYTSDELQVCVATKQQVKAANNEITTTTPTTVPSATPVHEIFQRDVEDAVTLETVNSNAEEDSKFLEIDSRLQCMFQSPAHEANTLPRKSINAPADKCANTSGMLDSSNDRLNFTDRTNLTINETNSFNEQNAAVTTSLLTDVSCSSSANGSSSIETKRISLGTSDYRFEKVSDNVVNLFITRKRNRKKKTKTNNLNE